MTRRRHPNRTAAPLVPPQATLRTLRAAAAECKACDLWKRGTQTVFGVGQRTADVIFVGEQPGNEEDLSGVPFIGPAGKLLDRALAQAGTDRERIYLTNVVKHFKWQPRGKRRLHEKPRDGEVDACLPWLEAEIALVRPALVVCLGATAARARKGFRVTRQRGEVVESSGRPPVMATVHPSSVLRAPDQEMRHREMTLFVADLKKAARFIRR